MVFASLRRSALCLAKLVAWCECRRHRNPLGTLPASTTIASLGPLAVWLGGYSLARTPATIVGQNQRCTDVGKRLGDPGASIVV